jgi:fatty-acyl-CoA synthase
VATLKTIPAALDAAAEHPNGHITFVRDDGTEGVWTWRRLRDRAREIAVALANRGMRTGDRVALVLPHAEEFVPTFLGVLQGGGVPVPLYPPLGMGQLGGYLDHCKHIVGASRSKLLVTTSQIKAVLGTVREAAPELESLLTFADLDGDAAQYRAPRLTLDDMAFIQFTSGSTSRPKGVVVTHGTLAVNCHAIMREGLNSNEQDRGVSWLPLFHDMGLIGFVIAPIMHQVPVTFLAPMAFLKRPATWLKVLSKHRGTITYAPNFAYALTTKRVRDEEIEGVDLSCVRVAGCGAEPVQAATMRAFAERFAKWGFREDAFVPSYGMAENSLAIAFSRGIPADRVSADKLWSDGVAAPAAADDANALEIVGCGKAFKDHEIRIVDTTSREVLPDRRVGEIEIRGASLMKGYFEDPEKTREVISPEGWLRTGDLGYLVDGSIFICGREKDVVIVNGRNYYPQDLEWCASQVEGVRSGCVVAFPTHKAGLDREAVVVVAEAKTLEDKEALATRIKTAIQQTTGLMVDDVVIEKPGTVPKTSSGKLQRSKARALYEAGELRRREPEGAVSVAKRVVESQLAHLKLSIFGGGKKS